MKKKLESVAKFIKNNILTDETFSETVFEAVPGRCVYISGCRKIKGYSACEITLECKGANAVIFGEKMTIENLVNGQIAVRGKVCRLEFE